MDPLRISSGAAARSSARTSATVFVLRLCSNVSEMGSSISRLIRFGDPTLRAEQSISADGGFDQRLGNDRVMFGATYFYTRLQRVIAFAGFWSRSARSGRGSGFVNRPGGLSGVETLSECFAREGNGPRRLLHFHE